MNPPSSLDVFLQTALVLAPEFILLGAAIAIMTASAFITLPRKAWCGLSAGALVLAFLVLLATSQIQPEAYSAVALNDKLSFYARLVLLVTGMIVLAFAHEEPADNRAGEFFGALLMIDAGAMAVATANEMVFLFVGLELVSLPTYLLLYLSRRSQLTQEAATKYFFLSIFSSGLFLYGLTFLYGTTGISNLKSLAYFFGMLPVPHPQLGVIALLFLLTGLCFRVAAVPLHFYAPDVYQGSPMVIAAALAWVPKAAGFLAIIRTLTAVFAGREGDPLVQKAILLSWIIAAATMILGNFMALLQVDLKRLLAYSSIAHAGYMMIGVTAAFANDRRGGGSYYGSGSVFYYLVVYSFMTLGTFGGLMSLRIKGRAAERVDDLAGLGWTHPWPALALSICLLSLAGIPPLAGFWGKLEIFGSLLVAAERGESASFFVLAVIGMLSAAAGAYYYLRLVVVMYFSRPKESIEVGGGWPIAAGVVACASLTVILGLFSGPLASATHTAAGSAIFLPEPGGPQVAEPVARRAPDHQPASRLITSRPNPYSG